MSTANVVASSTTSAPLNGAALMSGLQLHAEPAEAALAGSISRVAVAIILIGIDDRGRPHASRFEPADQQAVRAAAETMGFTTLPVTSKAMAELAGKLPAGKLFTSGKAFVPFVGQALFDRLVAYLPISARPLKPSQTKKALARPVGAHDAADDADNDADPATQAGNTYAAVKEGRAKPKANTFPADWDKIRVGHVVLTTADRDEGWWTAHVREDRGDGVYVLEWEDFEGMDLFVRRREQIALLHPAYDGQ